jgi:hypothetical protein
MTDDDIAVWRYYEDFGRMGDLSGVFVAKGSDVAATRGREVHLGEVLGKHSDVSITITDDNLKLVTSDRHVVDIIIKYSLATGVNPIVRLKEQDEGY